MKDFKDIIYSKFRGNFNSEPICVFSPGRINLIGEHVDYNDGFVFPAAIDKGIFGALAKSSGIGRILALDLDEDFVFSTNEMDIQDAGSWKNYVVGVVQELKKLGKTVPNFEMVFGGDIPGGAGLSSSAALENCIAFGLNELFGLGLSKQELIFVSQRAEHNYVGVKCGIMDQFASMFGQKDRALLLDCRTMEFQAFEIPMKDEELMLINTNVKHSLADSAYNRRRAACEKVSDVLGIESLRDADMAALRSITGKIETEEFEMAEFVIEEIERVQLASSCLRKGDLRSFGELMFETHKGLSNNYMVSCEELDFLVEMAEKEKGVWGARLMGGGFGGCTLNLIEKSRRDEFVRSVNVAYRERFGKNCAFYPVRIGDGTRIMSAL